MKQLKIGICGSGFAAELHLEAFHLTHGYDLVICAVASPSQRAQAFAQAHGIPRAYNSLEEMLEHETLDLVDICTPPRLHVQQIKTVLESGCHVICEKPLTGWFADPRTSDMLARVTKELDDLQACVMKSKKHFFYAENFVYAPAVQKSRRLLTATGDKILFLRGEESHSGSHAPHAALWSENGGGSLIRQGCHPLSALLYLKNCGVQSAICDTGCLTSGLSNDQRRNIRANPQDVEDLATLLFTFADGTKGSVTAGDLILGGVRNSVEVYTTGGVHLCNIAQSDQMRVYHVEDSTLQDEYFTEKVETKRGWQSVFLDEAYARGYVGELQDFLACAAGDKAQPESSFALAYETIRVTYAAYQSALEGKRIFLD